ncbi:MAG: PKD domain-containing protein [Thermoplasmata archaeon]
MKKNEYLYIGLALAGTVGIALLYWYFTSTSVPPTLPIPTIETPSSTINSVASTPATTNTASNPVITPPTVTVPTTPTTSSQTTVSQGQATTVGTTTTPPATMITVPPVVTTPPVVTIIPPTIQATLNASPKSGVHPLLVKFNTVVTGGQSPYTYYLLFGDGNHTATGGTGANNHKYSNAGNYGASMQVTDANGIMTSDYVQIVVS